MCWGWGSRNDNYSVTAEIAISSQLIMALFIKPTQNVSRNQTYAK
jgi:hypothetical protein